MTDNFKRLLAHKLGNLIMLARNPVEMLDEPDLPDDHREQLRAMLIESLERMEQICHDLTDLGRVEELDSEPAGTYHPGELVQTVVQQYLDTLRDSAHTLTYQEVSPLPAQCVGHAELIERAIEKLIENAVRFSPDGGPIEVSTLVEAGQWVVRITDHGLGIPGDHHEHIFEPFYRFKDRSTVHLPTLGLGLTVAWNIAQAHGGTIAVRGALGEGSTFTLLLPLGS